jgi:hypothetical protein
MPATTSASCAKCRYVPRLDIFTSVGPVPKRGPTKWLHEDATVEGMDVLFSGYPMRSVQ